MIVFAIVRCYNKKGSIFFSFVSWSDCMNFVYLVSFFFQIFTIDIHMILWLCLLYSFYHLVFFILFHDFCLFCCYGLSVIMFQYHWLLYLIFQLWFSVFQLDCVLQSWLAFSKQFSIVIEVCNRYGGELFFLVISFYSAYFMFYVVVFVVVVVICFVICLFRFIFYLILSCLLLLFELLL